MIGMEQLEYAYRQSKKSWDENYMGRTAIFRRFKNLPSAPTAMSYQPGSTDEILINSLLGKNATVDYNHTSRGIILNDAWTVNLKRPEKNMLESLRRVIEEQKGVDLGEELKHLHQIYTDGITKAKQVESYRHYDLVNSMRSYLEIYDERKDLEEKLKNLVNKVGTPKDEAEEDGDDE